MIVGHHVVDPLAFIDDVGLVCLHGVQWFMRVLHLQEGVELVGEGPVDRVVARQEVKVRSRALRLIRHIREVPGCSTINVSRQKPRLKFTIFDWKVVDDPVQLLLDAPRIWRAIRGELAPLDGFHIAHSAGRGACAVTVRGVAAHRM